MAEIIIHDELDSTSLEAKRLVSVQANLSARWIVALRQTAGYGRRERVWIQEQGDVATSLILPLSGTAAFAPAHLSFIVALAVREAMVACGVPEGVLTLKWPNDVLLNGAKMSGLLLELVGQKPHQYVVIGIGINIVTSPTLPEYPTARLLDAIQGPPPHIEKVISLLDERFFFHHEKIKSNGFAPIRTEWLKHASGVGQRISVRLPNTIKDGDFIGLSPDGALLLDTEKGVEAITAGDVFFS